MRLAVILMAPLALLGMTVLALLTVAAVGLVREHHRWKGR